MPPSILRPRSISNVTWSKLQNPHTELAQFQLTWDLNGKFQESVSIEKIFPGLFFFSFPFSSKDVAFKDTEKEGRLRGSVG